MLWVVKIKMFSKTRRNTRIFGTSDIVHEQMLLRTVVVLVKESKTNQSIRKLRQIECYKAHENRLFISPHANEFNNCTNRVRVIV